MAGDRGIVAGDRAVQARFLCQGGGRPRSSGQARMTKKTPVVTIHGGFCGPWAWDRFAPGFPAQGFGVLAPALPHHDGGKPPQALATTSLTDYAADLEALIAGMDAPPILVGHSMGGLLGQMLASRVKLAGAGLLAPSSPWGVPPSTLFEIGAAHGLMLRVGFWAMILEPSFAVAAAHSLDRFPQAERE